MINLLSLDEKKKIRSDYHLRVFSVCLPIFAVILFVATISLIPAYFFAQSSNANILKESQSAEAVSKKIQTAEMKKLVLEANKKILSLVESPTKSGAWDIFNEILTARLPGITITNYEYRKAIPGVKKGDGAVTSIILQGVAKRREIVQDFSESLRQNKNFVSVDLPISSLVSEANFSYNIKIVVKETK
jgi:hypothetical protein